ncbi:dihydrofolate reductase [Candidatus Peregrinibacteria bacterium]|jgi:dihydrofolate reductase|nr:dihydrofolate reductase [Candidatus Peregrinibacteria bacterium]MBT7736492.1 dihydrofolate reductase [Candidatus Peregrinibacteria bacterium]
MTDHEVYMIVAADKDFGIGKDGVLPWQITKEMKYFKDVTTQTHDATKENMVIMGRTTWESIPEKFRPLIDRKNVVLTSQKDYKAKGATVVNSIEAALNLAQNEIETIFVIGGGSVYKEFIDHPALTGIYLTQIQDCFDCDTFFPDIPEKLSQVKEISSDREGGTEFKYLLYKKA